MREIKFRAWGGPEQGWFDRVCASNYPDGPCSIVWMADKKKWVNFEGPICQYTGLHDKNDKEIYEGDIVKWQRPFSRGSVIAEVQFGNGCFGIVDKAFMAQCYLHEICESCEVIGNIYEQEAK